MQLAGGFKNGLSCGGDKRQATGDKAMGESFVRNELRAAVVCECRCAGGEHRRKRVVVPAFGFLIKRRREGENRIRKRV
jgi:hypothetical protein